MSRPTVPPDDLTDDGAHIIQKSVPVKGFHSPSKFYEDLQSKSLVEKIRVPPYRQASNGNRYQPYAHDEYIPTPEEIGSNSFAYCFDQPMMPLRPLEDPDESHQ